MYAAPHKPVRNAIRDRCFPNYLTAITPGLANLAEALPF